MPSLGRRSLLLRSGAGAAAVAMGGWLPGCAETDGEQDGSSAAATGAGVRIRQSWLNLDAKRKAQYREGVRLLNAERVAATNAQYTTQFQRLAFIHNQSCPHGNWFFLPWHRVYLLFYETELQRVLKDPSFALPYWDWQAQPKVPDEFWNGELNPKVLHQKTQFAQERQVGPEFRFPADSPAGAANLRSMEGVRDFYAFASYPSMGTNGAGDRQPQGQLEGTVHNYVHGTLGGLMGAFVSPLDPIFWLHHCNVDRLWNVWMAKISQARGSVAPYSTQTSVLSAAAAKSQGEYWLNYAYSLSATASDTLQTGTKTRDVMDSYAAKLKLPGEANARSMAYRYDTDTRSPMSPPSSAPPEVALRILTNSSALAATEDRRNDVRIDFASPDSVSSATTIAAKLEVAIAKPALEAFAAAASAPLRRSMRVELKGLPVPDDHALLRLIEIDVFVGEADVQNVKAFRLGTLAFFFAKHDASDPAHAHHGSASDAAQFALEATAFFDALLTADALKLPEAVWLSARYQAKKGLTTTPEVTAQLSDFFASLKAKLKSAQVTYTLVATVPA